MISFEKVKKLLQAYRDFDDVSFLKTAESIIEDSLTSNRMAEAKELKKALGDSTKSQGHLFRNESLNAIPASLRSEAELLNLKRSETSNSQIVFSNASKDKIERIIQEHKNKVSLHNHGLKAKSKILFWGPPGCGKTLTSSFLAHELGIPIATVQISSLISSYMGDTSAHIQKIFQYAKTNSVVLLLDEFDAIGKSRNDNQDVGEIRRVVNSLLQAFDSFDSDKSIIIAASNHQDILDEALWRRFDDIISFPKPSKKEIEHFLSKLLSGVKYQGSVSRTALEANDMSFAEIEKVVKEALKSVVMSGSEVLSAAELSDHFQRYNKDLSSARRTPKRRR